MKIILIAAVARNYAIGAHNDLLWHLPDDFKYFKSQTSGHFILMGRKTFESFPRPLPNRTHLIVTQQTNYKVPENCFVFSCIEDAIAYAQAQNQESLYVIGGGQVYQQTIEMAQQLEITWVDAAPKAEVFFPEFSFTVWQEVHRTKHEADERHAFAFDIVIYHKK